MEPTSTTDLGLQDYLNFFYGAPRSDENVLRTIYLHFLCNWAVNEQRNFLIYPARIQIFN